jgi:hypothetical protein
MAKLKYIYLSGETPWAKKIVIENSSARVGEGALLLIVFKALLQLSM